jgi:hypothetical protein
MKEVYYNNIDERHKKIHRMQKFEMMLVGGIVSVIMAVSGCGWWVFLVLPVYYYWYGAEWLIKWAYYRNIHTAHKNVGFEREAYSNQKDVCYLDSRVPFSWAKYILE